MTGPSVTTRCAFVRPGRAITQHHTEKALAADSATLWILDRRATSRGITAEQGIYKMTLTEDPSAPTDLPERYTLVFFEAGRLAVYLLDPEPWSE